MSIDTSDDPQLSNEPTQDSQPQGSQPHDSALMLASSAGGAP